MHSIFVQTFARTGTAQPRVLAHEIVFREDAVRLAAGLALSYPRSGASRDVGTFWFVDRDGLHRIWAV